jgi:hypothetical protein
MQSPHQISYKSTKRQNSVWHVCLCWLLCLSVWRGPVPVVHEHSLDLSSLANNSQLAEHAIKYHADCLGQEDPGLHFHFILLDQSSDSLLANSAASSQDALGAVDNILKLEQHHRSAMELSAAQLKTNQGDALFVAEDLRFSTTANASFLQTRLYRTPALAVLCVCLC